MTGIDAKSCDDVSSPLTAGAVRQRIKAILENRWNVVWTKHARAALADDNMTTVDATNVLRNWRYMDPAE